MSERNKLWCIDDVDRSGNCGMTILLARNEADAREKFRKMHGTFLAITEIGTCLAISFAMVEGKRGETQYERRAGERIA